MLLMQLHAEVQSVNGKHPTNVQHLIESLFVAELYQPKTCHLSRMWGLCRLNLLLIWIQPLKFMVWLTTIQMLGRLSYMAWERE